MAYLVSISFLTPLCAPPTSLEKMCWEKEPFGALSKTEISVSGTNHLSHCSSNRGLFSVNLSCHRHLTSSSKPLDGIVSFVDGRREDIDRILFLVSRSTDTIKGA